MGNTDITKKRNEKVNNKQKSLDLFIAGNLLIVMTIVLDSLGEYLSYLIGEIINNIEKRDNSFTLLLSFSIIIMLIGKKMIRNYGMMSYSDEKINRLFRMIDISTSIFSMLLFIVIVSLSFISQVPIAYSMVNWFIGNRWAMIVLSYVLVLYIMFILIEIGENFINLAMLFFKKINKKISEIKNPTERYTLLIAIFGTIISLITLIKE